MLIKWQYVYWINRIQDIIEIMCPRTKITIPGTHKTMKWNKPAILQETRIRDYKHNYFY